MDLSPGAHKILFIMPGPGKESLLRIVDLDSGDQKIVLKLSGEPESLEWCGFATEDQVICRYSANIPFQDALVPFSRLVTLRVDGSGLRQLSQRESDFDIDINQYGGDVLDWSSDRPGTVLVERNYSRQGYQGAGISDDKHGLAVERVDLGTLKADTVEPPRQGVSTYFTDARGKVRLMAEPSQAGVDGELTGIIHYRFRTADSREWKLLGDYDVRDGSGIHPLAVDAEKNSVYLLKKTDGRDALYAMKLDGTGTMALIAQDKRVDIDSVVRAGRTLRVIGYSFVDERPRTAYFDPEYAKLAQSLSSALPKQPLIDFLEASSDGSKLLILAHGDTSPGTFYYFDKANRHLELIGLLRPELAERTLAPVKPVTIAAPDGAAIPGYLTLPIGKPAKNLPTVILPHGGPSSRDEWGFSWLAQFLAARGYAVLQPEYRGSAGYGDVWLNQNGFRNWRTSIGDITASAKWLAAQGIADPNRTAILGWSYGGYAALQSAATEPSLYKAVIAIAPVTDLTMLKRDSQPFTSAKLMRQFVGSGDVATAGSPLRHAAAITAPVLLVHGDMDANVNVAHSKKMADALRTAGFAPKLLVFKGLDHYLEDSGARRQMLAEIGELLERTIGH